MAALIQSENTHFEQCQLPKQPKSSFPKEKLVHYWEETRPCDRCSDTMFHMTFIEARAEGEREYEIWKCSKCAHQKREETVPVYCAFKAACDDCGKISDLLIYAVPPRLPGGPVAGIKNCGDCFKVCVDQKFRQAMEQN